jgi:hypothetical protein
MHLSMENSQPPLQLLPYHPSFSPPPSYDIFLTSMIGRASMEWNSSVGVSIDAWHILATAQVACDICKKVRSLDGDCAHRSPVGKPSCMVINVSDSDDEDENIPIDKGKGRAFD